MDVEFFNDVRDQLQQNIELVKRKPILTDYCSSRKWQVEITMT
jgi:hypothetical protein